MISSAQLLRTNPRYRPAAIPIGRAGVALRLLGLVLTGVLLLSVGAAYAQTAAPVDPIDAEVRRISDRFRCPTCQAISVNDSEAAFSVQIRDKVRRMLLEGQSEEQIEDYFVSRYGEWILRAPKKEGLGLVLWILPGAVLLGCGGWIMRRALLRAREAADVRATVDTGDLTEQQARRLERDLRRFEEGV